jgi:hypothetical protein
MCIYVDRRKRRKEMIEEDAKKKWCPMVKYSSSEDDNNAANRWPLFRQTNECKCITTDCMMWRWHLTPSINPQSTGFGPYSEEDGYCGLGGKS